MSVAVDALRQCRQTYVQQRDRAIPGGFDATIANAKVSALDDAIAHVHEAEAVAS